MASFTVKKKAEKKEKNKKADADLAQQSDSPF
jgi:hypothetical protein